MGKYDEKATGGIMKTALMILIVWGVSFVFARPISDPATSLLVFIGGYVGAMLLVFIIFAIYNHSVTKRARESLRR